MTAFSRKLLNDLTSVRAIVEDGADSSASGATNLAAIQATVATSSNVLHAPGTYNIAAGTIGSNTSVVHTFRQGAILKPAVSATLILRGQINASPTQQIFDCSNSGASISLPDANNISIGWFGANPDGVTECGTAIKAAISATSATATVFIPTGTYVSNSKFVIPTGINLSGAGKQLSKFTISVADYCLQINSSSKVSDFSIGGIHRGMLLNASSDIQVLNLDISGATASPAGGDTYGLIGGIVVNGGCSDILIQNCYIHDNGCTPLVNGNAGAEIHFIYGTANKRVTIVDNHIKGSATTWACVFYNLQESHIRDNYIDQGNATLTGTTVNRAGYGIACYDTGQGIQYNNIISNRVLNCAGTGIYYESGPYATTYSVTPQAVITNNIITNTCQQQIDDALLVGAISCNAPHVVISNNNIDIVGADGAGIAVQGIGLQVIGNQITGVPVRPAIAINVVPPNSVNNTDQHAGTRIVVTNNSIVDCKGAGIRTNNAEIENLNISNNTCGWEYTTFTVNASTDTFTMAGRQLVNNQTIRFRQKLQTAVLATGTSPPVVTLSGNLSQSLIGLRIEITTGGSRGTALFRVSIDNGSTWLASSVTTIATYQIATTGVVLNFPVGSYTNNNVYISRLPGGLSANIVYYVINSSYPTFKVSLTSGGSAVDITDIGAGLLEFCISPLSGGVGIDIGNDAVTSTSVLVNGSICNNIIEGYRTGGIVVLGGSGNDISHNTVIDCSLDGSVGTYTGIYDASNDSRIVGNRSQGWRQGFGITSLGTSATIMANDITNNANAIGVQFDATSIVAPGNKITNNGTWHSYSPNTYWKSPFFSFNDSSDLPAFAITPGNGSTAVVLSTAGQGLNINPSGGGTAVTGNLHTDSLTITGSSIIGTLTAIKTTTYTAAIGENVRANPTSGGFTINLPTAVSGIGDTISVKNVTNSLNVVTIAAFGGELIDGSSTYTLSTARESVNLMRDGTGWMVI